MELIFGTSFGWNFFLELLFGTSFWELLFRTSVVWHGLVLRDLLAVWVFGSMVGVHGGEVWGETVGYWVVAG